MTCSGIQTIGIRIVAAMLSAAILAGLAACGAAATPSPTATPAPTATPTATPVPTEDPRPLLPDWVAACLCIGLSPFNPNSGALPIFDANVTEYRLADGRSVHIVWKPYGEAAVVASYWIEGSPAVVAKPDASPVTDAAVRKAGPAISIGQSITMTMLRDAFGDPPSDEIWTYNHVVHHSVRYPHLWFELVRLEAAADATYTVAQLGFDSDAYETPRGLRVGLTVRQVLDLYSTGTFPIEISYEGTTIKQIVIVMGPTPPGAFVQIHIGSAGTVTLVQFYS